MEDGPSLDEISRREFFRMCGGGIVATAIISEPKSSEAANPRILFEDPFNDGILPARPRYSLTKKLILGNGWFDTIFQQPWVERQGRPDGLLTIIKPGNYDGSSDRFSTPEYNGPLEVIGTWNFVVPSPGGTYGNIIGSNLIRNNGFPYEVRLDVRCPSPGIARVHFQPTDGIADYVTLTDLIITQIKLRLVKDNIGDVKGYYQTYKCGTWSRWQQLPNGTSSALRNGPCSGSAVVHYAGGVGYETSRLVVGAYPIDVTGAHHTKHYK